MKKIITFIFLNFNLIIYANNFENDRDTLKKSEYLTQEKLYKEMNEKSFSKEKYEEITEPNEIQFEISKIILEDNDKLLNKLEKDRIVERYQNKKLGANDITNLLIAITNKLIEDGYITSVATIDEDNNLKTGILKLKIISGKVDKILLNEKSNLKSFFLVKQKEEKTLNIRNLDTTTENFTYLESNNMKMDIVPSNKMNYLIDY